MIGIPLGIATAHVSEWVIHKYLLHDRGKKKGSFFRFHFHEHHSESRRNDFRDQMYASHPFKWNAAGKEVLALAGGVAIFLPLTPVAPLFVATMAACGARYYRLHKRAHLDPDWCRENLPWHYDHHMAPNQDCNWGVTIEWVDRLMGTRVPYLGTERELKDRARRQARLDAQAKAA